MHASYPAAIAQLDAVVRSIGTLTTADGIMRHQASFQAAHAALDEEHDAARRREDLSAIERLVPPAGPGRIFLLSFLASASDDARYLLELQRTLSQPPFTPEQRHFFYWQLLIRHPHIRGIPALEPAALYASLLASCRRATNLNAAWIDSTERDPDSIIVITNQLLGLQHAPTADCLDYCHVLQTRLQKKVFLVNTADMPWTLQLPYYNAVRFNYAEEYSNVGKLRFKDEAIAFHQCRKPMPNLGEVRSIVGTVLTRKPAFVLSLGHSNVAADLCSSFLTVATMPFGTNLPRARSNVLILPRKRRPDDAAFMQEWQIREERIVETEYTFRLPNERRRRRATNWGCRRARMSSPLSAIGWPRRSRLRLQPISRSCCRTCRRRSSRSSERFPISSACRGSNRSFTPNRRFSATRRMFRRCTSTAMRT